MNELDRKIAELKGWKFSPLGIDSPDGKMRIGILASMLEETPVEELAWSTSDAKALELVDELVKPDCSGAPFEIFVYAGQTPSARWLARFYMTGSQHQNLCSGVGATRSEAICRAYIAAMEWMRDRRAGG